MTPRTRGERVRLRRERARMGRRSRPILALSRLNRTLLNKWLLSFRPTGEILESTDNYSVMQFCHWCRREESLTCCNTVCYIILSLVSANWRREILVSTHNQTFRRTCLWCYVVVRNLYAISIFWTNL